MPKGKPIYEIRTIEDILEKIPPEKLDRFFEELKTHFREYHEFKSAASKLSSVSCDLVFKQYNWVDDGTIVLDVCVDLGTPDFKDSKNTVLDALNSVTDGIQYQMSNHGAAYNGEMRKWLDELTFAANLIAIPS